MANALENVEVPAGIARSDDPPEDAPSAEAGLDVADDLTELEFTPLPPEEASELEDRVYLLGARHGVRPF
ncbi:MAG TPA: hypothetical protein VN840_16690 [Streptosporangiaceae bacterium]|nr:hypothetical protein [Streptosporangiaceae bacterium]